MKYTNKIISNLSKVFLFMVLLSVEVTASVVSDNDGSAFITKGEFDSLKNNFQTQIDRYNNSIDSLIDVAISSYLAGIKADKNIKLTNIYDILGGHNIKFGLPDISPTVEPSTGAVFFFENGDRFGVGILTGPGNAASRYGIMNPNDNWWNG